MISGILEARRIANTQGRARLPIERLAVAAENAAAARVPRSFAAALAAPGLSLIAEIKKASPSKGMLRSDFHPAGLAAEYESGGARALSVLTEPTRFLGAYEYLSAARVACSLPCLQKDFILDEYQLYEGLLAGADAALLIVNILSDPELLSLIESAARLEIDALVEVHNEAELDRALAAGAKIVGINHRDLWSFEMNMQATAELAPRAKEQGCIVVAESGIASREDVIRVESYGVDAILVGESIVSSSDIQGQISHLLGSPV